MKLSTIKKKFKNQWVLLECTKTTEGFRIIEAIVLAHLKNKKDLYRKEAQLAKTPKNPLSIEFMGKYPEIPFIPLIFSLPSLRSNSL
ncbi:MAG: hypothetical protein EPO24_09245 [Bacteroidetes bacterium]|nr:MAG: hypothetical protein EPO24_09245 [Bacteroidota bacterium]